MSRYSDGDEYLDPVSGVLKNRFGIVDLATLESTEADLVAARSREIVLNPIPGKFDLAHLQAIHRFLFGDLYEWAGQLRTVDISKNGYMFAHYAHIPSASALLFKKLEEEKYLAVLDVDAFSSRLAYYLGEINALHPFREGNGRSQREFISLLAHLNGYYIAWELMKPSDLLQASIESFSGDLSKLTGILRSNIRKEKTEAEE
jgi:cell filamentation protein